MSAQEFKVNEQVRILAAEYAEEAIGKTGSLTGAMSDGAPFRDYNGIDHRFEIRMGDDYVSPGALVFASRIEKVEPEDAADVEPEPMKAGDHVLVWASVGDPEPDSDGDLEVVLGRAPGGMVDELEAYVRADAIVRPDAGQVPPWVKPAQCTSLFGNDTAGLARCLLGAEHSVSDHVGTDGQHWTDTEAYGRVEVSS